MRVDLQELKQGDSTKVDGQNWQYWEQRDVIPIPHREGIWLWPAPSKC